MICVNIGTLKTFLFIRRKGCNSKYKTWTKQDSKQYGNQRPFIKIKYA